MSSIWTWEQVTEIYSNCLKQKGARIGRVCGSLPELEGRESSRTHKEWNQGLKSTGKQVSEPFSPGPLYEALKSLGPSNWHFLFLLVHGKNRTYLEALTRSLHSGTTDTYLNSQFLEETYQIVQLRSAIHFWSPPMEASRWGYGAGCPHRRDLREEGMGDAGKVGNQLVELPSRSLQWILSESGKRTIFQGPLGWLLRSQHSSLGFSFLICKMSKLTPDDL